MSTTLKYGVLGANFQTGNMGVSALAFGALKGLLTNNNDVQVVFIDYAQTTKTITTRINNVEYNIDTINIRFSKNFLLKNSVFLLTFLALFLKLLPISGLRKYIFHHFPTLKLFSEIDCFFSINGGDSFSDIYGLRRFLYVAFPQFLIISMDKKLIQLPQTYGPFRLYLTRLFARHILNKSNMIYSRDPNSLHFINKFISKADSIDKVKFSYDLGFLLSPVQSDLEKSPFLINILRGKQTLIGINVSGLLYIGGYSRNNMFQLNAHYPYLIKSLIKSFILMDGVNVLLIPHVFTSSSVENDVNASREVYNHFHDYQLNKLYLIDGQFDANSIKHLIGKVDFFIGSRMHACIAAVSQCIPTIAIAYSDKFLGVFDSINLSSFAFDSRIMSQEQILSAAIDKFHERDKISMELSKTIPGIIMDAEEIFKQTF